MGSFLSYFFIFAKYKNFIKNQNAKFWGSVFYNFLIGVLFISVFVVSALLFTRIVKFYFSPSGGVVAAIENDTILAYRSQ